jgi:hypothetical protein
MNHRLSTLYQEVNVKSGINFIISQQPAGHFCSGPGGIPQTACSNCYTTGAPDSKKCSGCGRVLGRNLKFPVRTSMKGKRVTRVVDNLTIAREVEAAFKGDLVRNDFEIAAHKTKRVATLADVWTKYLPRAKEYKKSWKNDEWNYDGRLQPRFASKAMESITPYDIEKMKTELEKGLNEQGGPFAAATIKHRIVLLRRLFNAGRKRGMYDGGNPVERDRMPEIDNRKSESQNSGTGKGR